MTTECLIIITVVVVVVIITIIFKSLKEPMIYNF